MTNKMSVSNRSLLRLSATLIFAGVILSFLAGFFHPDHANANDHVAVFAEYASSNTWKTVHLGQFIGMTVLIAGLLALFFVLDIQSGIASMVSRFGVLTAGVAIALYGVLQAVDGIALKQVVDAWAAAPQAEKMMRFANAESIRWLEWAIRSYQSYMLGLSFLLFGLVILGTAKIPRLLGLLMGVSGLAYFLQGWIIGSEGFAASNKIPTLLGVLTILIWSIWLLIIAWSAKGSSAIPATDERPISEQRASNRKIVF